MRSQYMTKSSTTAQLAPRSLHRTSSRSSVSAGSVVYSTHRLSNRVKVGVEMANVVASTSVSRLERASATTLEAPA
jgi:hypothetical protein